MNVRAIALGVVWIAVAYLLFAGLGVGVLHHLQAFLAQHTAGAS